MTGAPSDTELAMPSRVSEIHARPEQMHDLVMELEASHQRESILIRDRNDLIERQKLLTQEFEHRLVNGLQIVASLLSLQSRNAVSPAAAIQLNDAALRVAAISRVHRRLHLLDNQEKVDFRGYVQELCADLSALLLHDNQNRKIFVSGTDGYLPVAVAIPLGFIVSELVTNSTKYTEGDTTVHVAGGDAEHSLTVTDQGPGLPDGFDRLQGRGIGMNIMRSLVKQIGGTLQFGPGKYGTGTSATVSFCLPQ
jgi:two-component sensor histidine kinase